MEANSIADHVASARAGVQRQRARVAKLTPGSELHKTALATLQQLEDALDAIETTKMALAASRKNS